MRNPAATPQPLPIDGQTEVTPLVIADLETRRAMGIQKYGTPLMVENGRNHLMDAYQEILDHAVYFRCAIAQQEALWVELMDLRRYAEKSLSPVKYRINIIIERLDKLLAQRPS